MVEARLFQALSDGTRLKILSLLGRGPMNVSRIVSELGHAQPAVSRHLRVLREVDLIHDKRRGKEVEYSLNHGQISDAAEYLENLLGATAGSAVRAAVGSARTKSTTREVTARRKSKGKSRARPAKASPQASPAERRRRDEPEYAIERRDDTMEDFLL